MLTICVTGNAMNFEDLSDEMYQELVEKYDLQLKSNEHDNSYFVEDEPQYLYRLLVKLSYNYDIEII